MTIENVQSVGEFVYVIKDEAISERGGLIIPESSVKKPNTGLIITVGENVNDKKICKGNKAIFSKQVGSEIELFGIEITVLNGNNQITGVIVCTQ